MASSAPPAPAAVVWHAFDDAEAAAKLLAPGEWRCAVCLGGDDPAAAPLRRVALLPCGHSEYCEACALRWVTTVRCACPLCQAAVQRVVRLVASSTSTEAEAEGGHGAAEAFECDAEVQEHARATQAAEKADQAPDLSCLDSAFFAEELRALEEAAHTTAERLSAEHAAPVAVARAREILATAQFWGVFVTRSPAAPQHLLRHGAELAQTIALLDGELRCMREAGGCGASARVLALQERERRLDEEALAAMEPEDSAFCYRATHPPPLTLLDTLDWHTTSGGGSGRSSSTSPQRRRGKGGSKDRPSRH